MPLCSTDAPLVPSPKWDGSSWSTLRSGLGEDYVEALAVSGGDLYAGGYLTTAGGCRPITLPNGMGAIWSALSSGTRAVAALAVLGNDLYVGGDFTTVGGASGTNVANMGREQLERAGLGDWRRPSAAHRLL
jgi:hypothetical protein